MLTRLLQRERERGLPILISNASGLSYSSPTTIRTSLVRGWHAAFRTPNCCRDCSSTDPERYSRLRATIFEVTLATPLDADKTTERGYYYL
ncbi:hypothetical protein AVEN_93721-1 [Araneus ventricosus]|uniref:Uncharacterized protein n=1 Tax=Araneus ventricosus TaxID=182803 RepID=A0A4Y2WNN3_ARAVE|nr:hypothetical protein AVEN_226153-1 [Araneus ventricosus]GBO38326.1 hypothetical protein AVEN_93721-1 [Araneus ventricosus]